MASAPLTQSQRSFLSGLNDPARAIGGPVFDAMLFWGIPLLCFTFVQGWMGFAMRAQPATGEAMAVGLVALSTIVTYAHLFAVTPRAYLNRDVYDSNRRRLTVVPLLLLAALFASPLCLLVGGLVAVFWDVHHTAMQNFGLGRIYDMKAGNRPDALRTVDLRLNWVLYVGPILTGTSLFTHFGTFQRLDGSALHMLTALPGLVEQHSGLLRTLGIVAWIITIGWAAFAYLRARAQGYHIPAHKAALLLSTGTVSILAWGFSPPIIAFAAINLYHAIQYFALVWLKEGKTMGGRLKRPGWSALLVFLAVCGGVGVAYQAASKGGMTWIMAPFIACSLLHFWFDSFVWSVTKKRV